VKIIKVNKSCTGAVAQEPAFIQVDDDQKAHLEYFLKKHGYELRIRSDRYGVFVALKGDMNTTPVCWMSEALFGYGASRRRRVNFPHVGNYRRYTYGEWARNFEIYVPPNPKQFEQTMEEIAEEIRKEEQEQETIWDRFQFNKDTIEESSEDIADKSDVPTNDQFTTITLTLTQEQLILFAHAHILRTINDLVASLQEEEK